MFAFVEENLSRNFFVQVFSSRCAFVQENLSRCIFVQVYSSRCASVEEYLSKCIFVHGYVFKYTWLYMHRLVDKYSFRPLRHLHFFQAPETSGSRSH